MKKVILSISAATAVIGGFFYFIRCRNATQ